ncbi:MAG: CPBP family intramembrane metalloprotease [Planctomycetaceae bacterium]|jgi:membrane protease YdiL (CAAX protease family)|nr:CPBP family intramembrane metalloprotease [Planctomycetaceae bacterium]
MKTKRFFLQAVLFEGGLGVIALFFGFLFGLKFFRSVFFDVEVFLIIFGLTLPLLVCYFVLRLLPFESLRAIDRLVSEIFQKYLSHLSILQLAIISVAAGFGEEFFFRGLLQSGICEVIDNYIAAGTGVYLNLFTVLVIIFVSILFGIAHAITKIYFFLAFLISVYLGLMLILTGNMIIPIAVHAFYDFFIFVFHYQKSKKQNQ